MSTPPPPPPPPPPAGDGAPEEGQPWTFPPGPPQPENPYAAPPAGAPPAGPAAGQLPAYPPWQASQGMPSKRGFAWWEAVAGAVAGVAGNVLLFVFAGSATGVLLLAYNAGWLVLPVILRHASYSVGFLVGIVGAVALSIVIILYTCNATYGNNSG